MPKLKLGVLVPLRPDPRESLDKVVRLGLPTCQVCTWEAELYARGNASALRAAMREARVEVTALWAGYPGPRVWNLVEGPATIGLVPSKWRGIRVKALKRAARFAADCGIDSIVTHVGFLPEDPNDAAYGETVKAVRQVARCCEKVGVEFWFESGQETPTTLLRTIQDVGAANLGINLDPANLIVYGKANPVDALDVFGKHVRGVHAKDGFYPTDGRSLGREVPLGKGKVSFPVLIPKLYKLGFRGALTIEREISGPQQIRDIKSARKLLEAIVKKLR